MTNIPTNDINTAQDVIDNYKALTYPNSNILTNWYKALPYGFKFTPRGGIASVTMFLPISPSNLQIVTHYATNVVTTLYGTVEEHSEQRYFDIAIEGSTSMVPRYYDLQEIQIAEKAARKPGFITGRTSFAITDTIPQLGGFFQKTIGIANQVVNKAADTINPPVNKTGVDVTKTGYAAFHNLYRFFLYYKQDTSGITSTAPRIDGHHPLIFFNYKDGNKYKCSVQRFTLKRSVDSPMTYNYSIILRAYGIDGINADEGAAFILDDRLKVLGLNGVDNSSVFSKIKDASKGVKDVVGGILGGTNILGG